MTARVTVYTEQALREAYRLSTPKRVAVAHEAAGEARADAPVRSGEYRDGIGVKTEGERVFLVDEDPESIYKEYGTHDTPAHAVLTDAARRHGRYSGWQARG